MFPEQLGKTRRMVLDKGYADTVILEPKKRENKIAATILNMERREEKAYDVDKALYGCYELIEFSPKTLQRTVVTGISLYLVERIWSLTLLEMIR